MLLAESMASTAAMQALFDARASVRAMLAVEAGLAQAGAAAGLVSRDAAAAIASACEGDGFDAGEMAQAGAVAGTVVIPLVKWLRAQVPEWAAQVHVGGTSQDVMDTGLVLQRREGVALLLADLGRMAAGAAGLARAHGGTAMLGRTLLQAAMPTSFGLKASGWLAAIDDSRAAVAQAAEAALVLQCGGAAGTLDAVGDRAAVFLEALGAALGLAVPAMHWQTRRAPLARLAAAIAGAVGVAGKIGTDIALMMQSEVGEVAEPAAPGRGGSSAMAHKRNPTLSIAARAAAIRAPGYVGMLLAAQVQEHERAAGAWQAEAAVWPALMLCASGGIAAMAEALEGLEVDAARMAGNLALIEAGRVPAGAAWMIARVLEAHNDES